MTVTYEQIITKINSLHTPTAYSKQIVEYNLAYQAQFIPEMKHYLQRIGYKPEDFNQLQIIHVTGTKGKGSTCALTQSILHHYPLDKPLKIGLHTSPHLISIRERFRINGEPISKDLFTKYANEVWCRLENTKNQAIDFQKIAIQSSFQDVTDFKQRPHPDKPFFFDILNLIAFHLFVQEKVDVAIIEVGIGGEHDKTNIIEAPIVCGIISLGMDHLDLLGYTIDQIAWHKAGIIKNNRPVISIEQSKEALEVIKQRAKEKNATLKIINYSVAEKLNSIEIGLSGDYQRYNAILAISLAKVWLEECRNIQFKEDEVVPAGFIEGLKKVIWPGRAQIIPNDQTKYVSKVIISPSLTWYLDSAHTFESIELCSQWFKNSLSNITDDKDVSNVLIFNHAKGRDGPGLLKILSHLQNTYSTAFDHIILSASNTFRYGFSLENTYNNHTSIDDVISMHNNLANCWVKYRPDFNKNNIHVFRSVEESVDWIVDYANQNQNLKIQVLVTGTFYLVGNTLTVLGMPLQ